ncbi:hypothetical protein JTB14_004834 [Gonioctena quinquepunctata]|nr:hypothetical protein JTB14_004834 [Gonioctena quinquepunctata]
MAWEIGVGLQFRPPGESLERATLPWPRINNVPPVCVIMNPWRNRNTAPWSSECEGATEYWKDHTDLRHKLTIRRKESRKMVIGSSFKISAQPIFASSNRQKVLDLTVSTRYMYTQSPRAWTTGTLDLTWSRVLDERYKCTDWEGFRADSEFEKRVT